MQRRTDDYSSNTNSINPSPKKQPRLNIKSDDASLRKRSKVESNYSLGDPQALPDMQFIDSITPEHSVGANNTIYACAQVHNQPTVQHRQSQRAMSPQNRYSSPENLQVTDRKIEKDGRYSFPGADEGKYVCRFAVNEKNERPVKAENHAKNRSGEQIKRNESEYSKLSIPTPSSPSKSPHYSLLVGETSSENSSSLNTPVYDMEMTSAIVQFDQRMQGAKRQLNETKEMTNSLLSDENVSATNFDPEQHAKSM